MEVVRLPSCPTKLSLQLKDRHAKTFAWQELKDALLATFVKLNALRREAGVDAVSLR